MPEREKAATAASSYLVTSESESTPAGVDVTDSIQARVRRTGIYAGGKNGDGVYQRIINLIPPHIIFIEACAGSAAITRNIKPAVNTLLIEIDPTQAAQLKASFGLRCSVVEGDYMKVIEPSMVASKDTVIFFDPPYLKSVRSCERDLYSVEWKREDHVRFLQYVQKLACNVIITHPRCLLYEAELEYWHKIPFEYNTRNGVRKDTIWLNYNPPEVLHDYSYVGKDRSNRQRIKRKIEREIYRLSKLQAVERNAIVHYLSKHFK